MTASILVDQVSLTVPIYVQRERRASGWVQTLLGAAFDPPKRETTRLLESISFEAREGDRIAILGRNGAGKSTLLRVLNGVYAPTAGRVEVTGTCQALLNISLGFNGEATVRENILLRGTAMGLSSAQLRAQIEPILDFSGLHDKSNHRLRTLSSGQKMRLGFAISTAFQHDVILMDEWVGAGDAAFMAKATERMRDRVGGSKIVVLASHSAGLLRGICNRGILLEQGRLVFAGDIVSSLRAYHELLARLREEESALPGEGRAASTYGFVEQLVVQRGVAHLQGWCVTQDGMPPEVVVMSVEGERLEPIAMERYERPDVVRHLGLKRTDVGFRAQFALPHVHSLAELDTDLQVYGGASPAQATSVLRLAPAVVAMMHETRHAAATGAAAS